jgi:hypothetical protein
VKHLIAALFAGSLAFSSAAALAADTGDMKSNPPPAETKTEKAKEYVKEKAHNAKETTKRVAKKSKRKVKNAVANRKTTDPAQVSESKPDATPPAK